MSWVAISTLTAIGGLLLTAFTTAVVWTFRHVLPAVKHWGQFGTNLIGTPADARTGQVFAPSIFERLDQLSQAQCGQNVILADQNLVLAEVKEQVANTHDTNLRHDLDHLIGRVNDLHAKVDGISAPAQTTTVTVNPPGEATP